MRRCGSAMRRSTLHDSCTVGSDANTWQRSQQQVGQPQARRGCASLHILGTYECASV